jgi:hypothetical protein
VVGVTVGVGDAEDEILGVIEIVGVTVAVAVCVTVGELVGVTVGVGVNVGVNGIS